MLQRHAWRWRAIAILALITSAAAMPASSTATGVIAPRCGEPAGDASAEACAPQSPGIAGPRYVGWTYLNLNYCAPGMACIALYRDATPAWSWSGSAWRPASLGQGWVYVYPYTGAWRWAWTRETGWVAITGGRFELRSF